MNDKFMKKKLPDRWKLPAKWKKTILVMKMSLILMVWLTISTSAAVYSQHETVTLDVKSSTLIEVLTRIKDQTGVRILYNVSGLCGVTCKDIVLKDVPVEDALRRVLSGTAFGYEQIEGVFVIKAVVKDEKKSVTIRGSDGKTPRYEFGNVDGYEGVVCHHLTRFERNVGVLFYRL